MKFNINHFAFIALAASALAGQACTLTDEDDPYVDAPLSIVVENPLITADGNDYARIIVKEGDREVTEGVTIYNAKTNKPEELPDFRFTTNTPGTYRFWASYKTKSTSAKDPAQITAISGKVPVLPNDGAPNGLSFERKLFFIQFTGTGCGYCPIMTNLLREYAAAHDNFVLAACHSYNNTDPAYFSGGLTSAMSISGFPTSIMNLDKTLRFSTATNLSALEDMASKELSSSEALAGLCASTTLDGNQIVIKAGVKAAVDGTFRLGAWLLEDGIEAEQANYNRVPGDFSIHNNCLRATIGQSSANDYFGEPVSLKAGETAEQFYIVTLNEKWKRENCHVVVYVTTANGNSFKVNNVIDCPVNASVAYKYN